MTKEIRPVYMIACEKALLDDSTKNLSAINLVEEITVTGNLNETSIKQMSEHGDAVFLPFNFNLVSLWNFDQTSENFEMTLNIIDPNNKTLITETKTVPTADMSKNRQRITQVVGAIPFSGSGYYKFEHVMKVGQATESQHTLIEIKTN